METSHTDLITLDTTDFLTLSPPFHPTLEQPRGLRTPKRLAVTQVFDDVTPMFSLCVYVCTSTDEV